MTHSFTSPLFNLEESLLVVIDMQERLVPAMAEKEGLVDNVLRLVKFARIMEWPVVLTEQQKLGPTIPDIQRELNNVQPIGKTEFNCFLSEPFLAALNGLNRKNLVVAGIEAHICVTQTALGALPDYGVQVVSDAVSSRAIHNRETAMVRMQQHGVLATSTEMVIYELLQRAGTDTFKEVLKLVK